MVLCSRCEGRGGGGREGRSERCQNSEYPQTVKCWLLVSLMGALTWLLSPWVSVSLCVTYKHNERRQGAGGWKGGGTTLQTEVPPTLQTEVPPSQLRMGVRGLKGKRGGEGGGGQRGCLSGCLRPSTTLCLSRGFVGTLVWRKGHGDGGGVPPRARTAASLSSVLWGPVLVGGGGGRGGGREAWLRHCLLK